MLVKALPSKALQRPSINHAIFIRLVAKALAFVKTGDPFHIFRAQSRKLSHG